LSFALEYQSCRIPVPDLELPVAAILVDREYYSFFNAVQELSKVLAIVAKLGNRGDSTAITKTEARLCNLGHRARSRWSRQAILAFLSVSQIFLALNMSIALACVLNLRG
jgi:hypothetical protein